MKIILDFRGLALHSYFKGKDPDAWEEEGEEMRTTAHALENFVQTYLVPITDRHSILDVILVKEGGNQFRKSIYPPYKEKRDGKYSEAKSANIRMCVDAVQSLCDALGILSVRSEGCEADDTIGWLCEKLPGPKEIHTVDKDLIQLASTDTRVFLKGEEAVDIVDDAGNVVLPRDIALYKGIVGDPSDGYPGVPGMGPAAYRKLSQTFNESALAKVVEHEKFGAIEHIQASEVRKLLDNRDLWKTCHTLARLHPGEVERSFRVSGTGVDAVFRYRRPEWSKKLPQEDKVREVLWSCGAEFLFSGLRDLVPTQTLMSLSDLKSVPYILDLLAAEPFVSVDFETDAEENENFTKASNGREFVDVYGSEIVSMGITFGRHMQHTYYLTFGHRETDECRNLPLSVLDEVFRAVPESHVFICQNASFERSILLNTRGIETNNIHDTLLMASYVDENKPLPEHMLAVYNRVDEDDDDEDEPFDPDDVPAGGSFKSKARSGWDLKFMARRYLNYRQTEYRDVVPKGMGMRDITAADAFHYGADDPLVTAHLYGYLRTILETEGTWAHVRDNEFPSACLISDAFVDGVTLDTEEMARQEAEDRKTLAESVEKMRALLRENQTPELVRIGVAKLYVELSEEVKAKARFDKVPAEELTEKLKDLYAKLEATVPYRDYTRREQAHKFDVTPGKLEAICEAFGLPVLEDLKKETIEAYVTTQLANLRDARVISTETQHFLNNLQVCSKWGEFAPKRRGEIYKKLRDHCYEAWQAALPDDKKYEYEGFEFNLGSPAQKKLLMYGMMALPLALRNPKVSDTRQKWGMQYGPVQTSKEAIADAIANQLREGDWRREVLELLTKAQRCATRIGLFYTVWPLWVHPKDGNVHPGIRCVGTETHRPSGSNPNLLQLPKRNEGKKVRKCILPNKKFG
jgi:5'-3' exonuclease